MAILSGKHKDAIEIAKALGLEKAFYIKFELKTSQIATVEAKFNMYDYEAKELIPILKKYKLVEIEDQSK